ncbi:hypothetical protein EN801_030085 [Mesorhizobium sp. M00.F.Ca.ET.158.01.1.1]|nr:hypothetical protein EN801_030085 [Mesorhizobium sp. M00.F.Ca.ET.158.01.1.1]
MDELPDRAIADLKPSFGELGDKPAQREGLLAAAPNEPVAPGPDSFFGLEPPTLRGATLPVSSSSFTHSIAAL